MTSLYIDYCIFIIFMSSMRMFTHLYIGSIASTDKLVQTSIHVYHFFEIFFNYPSCVLGIFPNKTTYKNISPVFVTESKNRETPPVSNARMTYTKIKFRFDQINIQSLSKDRLRSI